MPRGRHRFEPVRLSIADPFGLAEARLTLDDRQTLVVYPRLVELERFFFDGGAGPEHGRRLLLRRPVGFDLHSVRDYQQGESLRRVHWPSTARRGSLMVKELEDSPRDEVAVLLDGDPAAVTGSPPDSSFDAAVRAAGSILRAQVRSGRRCVLLLNNAARDTQVISADGPEWHRALELWRRRSPTPRVRRPRCFGRPTHRPRARSSSSSSPPGRAVARRPAARACAHAPRRRARPRRGGSFAGAPRRPVPELLRLQAAGVPVAVVRQGDDLGSAARREPVEGGTWVGRGGRSRSVLLRSSSSRWHGCASSSPWGPCRRVRAPPLGLAAALPRGRWTRLAAAVVATVVAARIAVGVDLVPWRLDRPGSAFGLSHAFSRLGTRFGNGFDDFYSTHLPFDPRVHAAMHELVLSGVFVFALGVALLVAARRPVAAALALLLGAGWPATLLGPSRGIAMGAAILGGVLVLLAGLGSRRCRHSPFRPAWSWLRRRSWSARPPQHVTASCTGRRGISRTSQSGRRTWGRVERAVRRAPVLRASHECAPGAVRRGAHLPARDGARRLQGQRVGGRVASLGRFAGACGSQASGEPDPAGRDRRCARRHPPRRRQHPDALRGRRRRPAGAVGAGFAALDQNLPQGFRYTAWSYTRRPSAAALRRSPPDYPSQLESDGLLTVGDNLTALPFGLSEPDRRVLRLATRAPGLHPYVPLARLADRLTRGTRNPYDAVERLEQWFVSSGTFRYSNHPPVLEPPLVGFVTRTHAGYCQYFAGAMALMLRYLGIPARVAAGFAGGAYDPKEHVWNVSDREAHAWVEVWFKGYGWLPFDPTPAAPGAAPRQTLAGVPAAGGTGREVGLVVGEGVRNVRPRRERASPSRSCGRSTGSARHRACTARRRRSLSFRAAGATAAGRFCFCSPSSRRWPQRRARQGRLSAEPERPARPARCRRRVQAGAHRVPRRPARRDTAQRHPRRARRSRPEGVRRRARGVRRRGDDGPLRSAGGGRGRGPDGEAELRALLGIARRTLSWPDRVRGLFSLRSLARPGAVGATETAGSGIA